MIVQILSGAMYYKTIHKTAIHDAAPKNDRDVKK